MLGLAVDDTPDSVLQAKPRDWYVGGYTHHGQLSLFPIESPAKLYSAAARVFRMREGTLMALANSSTATLSFAGDADLGGPFADLEFIDAGWQMAAASMRRSRGVCRY